MGIVSDETVGIHKREATFLTKYCSAIFVLLKCGNRDVKAQLTGNQIILLYWKILFIWHYIYIAHWSTYWYTFWIYGLTGNVCFMLFIIYDLLCTITIRAARQLQIFSAGVIMMYLGTLNTIIKTITFCKIGNNWSRAPKVKNFQKYPKMSCFFLFS